MRKIMIMSIICLVLIVACKPRESGTTDESTTEANSILETNTTTEADTTSDYDVEEAVKNTEAPFTLIEGSEFLSDVYYNDYEDTVFDIFYLPDGEVPSGVVFYVHGGSFISGDKGKYYANQKDTINELLANNIAFVSVNYRFIESDNPDGVLRSMEDVMYALQYIRHFSDEYNIDKDNIILSGDSAGAGTSLWIGLQDNMADLQSGDSIHHESTRVNGIAIFNTQASYDLRVFEQVFSDYGFDLEEFILSDQKFMMLSDLFYGEMNVDILDDSYQEELQALNMLSFFSSDDPEIWVDNSFTKDVYPSDLNILYHHPNHAREIHRYGWYSGVKVTAYYEDYQDASGESYVDFIIRVINGDQRSHSSFTDELQSLPKTSPNGELIAYISPFDFEISGSLWIENVTTGERQKVVNLDTSYDSTVKAFEWINDDNLYYIEGFSFGTVSQGGELYQYNRLEDSTELIKRVPDGEEIINVNVHETTVTLSKITFDSEYMYYETDLLNYELGELPLDEIYVNKNNNRGKFMIEVTAPIYNIRLISVEWNETTEEIEDGDILEYLDSAENVILVIDSILPEGMPHEKLVWEDGDGNEHYTYISYNGRTGNHYIVID